MLLLIAAFSSWLGYWVTYRETLKLESQLAGLRSAARELQVDDEDAISIVSRHQQWNDENIWDFHLPDSPQFRVCVATENILAGGFTEPTESMNLDPGRHKMELIHDYSDEGDSLVSLLIDDKVAIEISRPPAWDERHGSSGGSANSESQEFSPKLPLVVYRKRFMVSDGNGNASTPQGPANGIQVWIQPANE